ncbi:MAG TPA: glucose-6-phosphate dehydrogenase [Urbifossiella sp.]|nr:glucose-6-phosphate dehydrogenase [Urbifossiella sp.]
MTDADTTHAAASRGDPCTLVLFGASGDLTRRLLTPALYNLACDGLLPEQFALIGVSKEDFSPAAFRDHLTASIGEFNTRGGVDPAAWDPLAARLNYLPGDFADPETYRRLAARIDAAAAAHGTGGNVLFYLATPPPLFALIAEGLAAAGLHRGPGWRRLVVEKPFGKDLKSAAELNRRVLAGWAEDQVYRIDHYLGKETVQNLLVFRFANGMFEPLWNKTHVDHIQFTVSETVGVEGRGGYYDHAGVLRDMIENHMFQMLAYLCMEPPASFRPDAVRDEKAKLLNAVRVYGPAEVARNVVRGQYGPGKKPDGAPAAGYREEPGVDPQSRTETFAALRLFIDNWRWEGVPIYLRSGKRLWKRGTEIVVQFRRAPEVTFRDTPAAGTLESNRLVFHVQPEQAVELHFHAKAPGPVTYLQKVDMRFDYGGAFRAARGTGYETLLHNAMRGDATLYSRADLVEAAWRVAQPVLDAWKDAPVEEANVYPAGSWGPTAAFDLMTRDGRRWVEVLNRTVLERVPFLAGADPVCLHNLSLMLQPLACAAGEVLVREGEVGTEMYVVGRGRVEVFDRAGKVLTTRGEGEVFGELSLLHHRPRTASVRAVTPCDLFVLHKADFDRVLRDHPAFAEGARSETARRYGDAGG